MSGESPGNHPSGDSTQKDTSRTLNIQVPSQEEYEMWLRCEYFRTISNAAQQYQNSLVNLSSALGQPLGSFTYMPPQVPTTPSRIVVRTTNNHVAVGSRCHNENTRNSVLSSASIRRPTTTPGNLDKLIWIDGLVKDVKIPEDLLDDKGRPYFGWAFCHVNTSSNRCTNIVRWYCYCMGVFQCSVDGCTFCARPLWPSSKYKGAPPKFPSSVQCPRHPDQELVWVRCDGGDPTKTIKSGEPMPCTLTLRFEGNSSVFVAEHVGKHSHARPPVAKPSPDAKRKLAEIVKYNPDAGPVQLTVEKKGRPSMASIDASFYNQDRLGYYARKTKNQNLRPIGIRGSVGALFEFNRDIPETFFVNFDILTKNSNIITMQTPYMLEVQREATGGLQSDTIEGAIHNANSSWSK